MALDPQVQPMLDLIEQLGFSFVGQDVATLRQLTGSFGGAPVDVPMASVVDTPVPTAAEGVWVRVYTPASCTGGAAPGLVWIHGGGWVIGSVEMSDATARLLAAKAGVVVVSVEYRLAPEHPYPAPVDDCLATFEWVAANAAELGIDPARLAVGGDSAGGNLSALVAIHARDHGIPLRYQLLVYPATDLTRSFPSIEENGEGYMLTKDAMDWFIDHYLGEHDPKDPRISPYHVDDLAGVAPAAVHTAEFDPLRDEGEAYAERLRAAGVAVDSERWDGQIHGFFGMNGVLDAADRAIDRAAADLRAALA